MTLIVDLVKTKSIGSCPHQDQSACKIWKLCDKQLSRWLMGTMFTFFYKSDPCVHDLWPTELTINRGNALTKTNQHVRCESSVIQSFQDNQLKQFVYDINCLLILFFLSDPGDLDFWPIDQKNNIGLSLTRLMSMWNIKVAINSSKNNQQKTILSTDRQMARQTDQHKQNNVLQLLGRGA